MYISHINYERLCTLARTLHEIDLEEAKDELKDIIKFIKED